MIDGYVKYMSAIDEGFSKFSVPNAIMLKSLADRGKIRRKDFIFSRGGVATTIRKISVSERGIVTDPFSKA